ncbi:helix-turn-helix transcriptional regulator [Kitasatospora sp. YST-16]|uniref:helix-turn-helix domain-containing protein n=1 Tax=Kitasatospora sp. YST-16 TaxID=2998080 RepID=UPI002284416F|nr:helix-turn-helix transcriptional regulator [Kitasatospora sp. YST-16]WAL71182.1 helix-turn-helix transcriptional regulator [Kitasatospora sp. YST-16]WNW37219.1 helix-turn-helix transcriptional regulator [Streptomyces sp. Li-HN-5-13]
MNKKDLDPTISPAHAFGVQFRRSREAKGLTQAQLGDLLGVTGTYVGCFERASRMPHIDTVNRADEVLETGGTLALMYWNIRHTALFEGFPEFTECEAKATELRLFELGIMPGLLQTPEYAQVELAAGVSRGNISTEQAAERLSFRLARQAAITRQPAPMIHVVMDESALRWQVGGPAVMVPQLRRVEELAGLPNMIIQVAPFSLGARRPFHHSLTLLTLPNHMQIGYVEDMKQGHLVRDIPTVREWSRDYARLQADAPSVADSMATVRAVRKELER